MYSEEIRQKIADFRKKYPSRCFALMGWKNRQMKDFSLDEMLAFFIVESNNSIQKMLNMIDHLVQKKDANGRAQEVHTYQQNGVDLIRTPKGTLKLIGYNPNAELRRKGQHQRGNINVTKEGEKNKAVEKMEDRLMDLGVEVRKLFPNEDNHFITFAMQAIKKYAAQRKINQDKVVNALKKGRCRLDTDLWRIVPNVHKESKERKVIVINESDFRQLMDYSEMTEQKFHSNIRKFISELLQDPVNAQPSSLFKFYGLNRSSLLHHLLSGNNPIIRKKERISDRDENGEPKTATMMVKFSCPKKDFDRKLQKLFIKLFERNVPPRKPYTYKDSKLNEEGEGGATAADASGAFVTKLGNGNDATGIMRRKMPVELAETDTNSVGDYQYTVPFGGDKETLARKNGVGGSVSINKA